MLCLQALDNSHIKITESMIGYSLLYPLTDDMLDLPTYTQEQKKSFLTRFSQLIKTGDAEIEYEADETEIWAMFNLIEKQWPRKENSHIYEELLELLIAQKDSMKQLGGPNYKDGSIPIPTFEAVWEVTFRKGAYAVINDALLVKGHISEVESAFAGIIKIIDYFTQFR